MHITSHRVARIRLIPVSALKTVTFTLLLTATLMISGCNAVQGRIDKNPTAFAALSPEDQARIRKHIVAIGDSTEIVYIARGKPDEIFEKDQANVHKIVWRYDEDAERKDSGAAPSLENLTFNPELESVDGNAKRDHLVRRILVTFVEDKVTFVQELKPR